MSSISFVIMSVDPDLWRNWRGFVFRLLPAQEGLDDAHVAAAARAWMLWCFWLLGLSARRNLGAGRLDVIERNERHGKQLTDTLDILGAGLTGQEAVVADAVEARWQTRSVWSVLAQPLEPPYTDPYVRWCGRGGAERRSPLSRSVTLLRHGAMSDASPECAPKRKLPAPLR